MTAEEYIKSRLEEQNGWYSNKSSVNKKYHMRVKITILIASSLIPVIATFDFDGKYNNVIMGGLGALVAVLSGLHSIKKYDETWISYRKVSESLKRERVYFETNTSPYRESSNDFGLLVERVEKIIAEENKKQQAYDRVIKTLDSIENSLK